jgi:hypothetical protein
MKTKSLLLGSLFNNNLPEGSFRKMLVSVQGFLKRIDFLNHRFDLKLLKCLVHFFKCTKVSYCNALNFICLNITCINAPGNPVTDDALFGCDL